MGPVVDLVEEQRKRQSFLGEVLAANLDLPERALLETAALVSDGHGTLLGAAFVPVAGVLFCLAGLLWAIPYAMWAEPRLRGPDWLRGLTFALLPTVTSWLVVLPALGAGPLGLGLGAGLVPAAGELVRHLLYGAALTLEPRDVSAAKAAASEAALLAARASLQTHGAIGFTQEHDLSLWLLRVQALRSAWGTPEEHRRRVLEAL